jgi:hypothetical protein
LSRIGIILCTIYAAITVVCLTLTFSADDFKSQYVFLQLPIALQLAGLDALGLIPFLRKISWTGAYLLLAFPSFIFLYSLGWLIDGWRSNSSIKRDALKRAPYVKR